MAAAILHQDFDQIVCGRFVVRAFPAGLVTDVITSLALNPGTPRTYLTTTQQQLNSIVVRGLDLLERPVDAFLDFLVGNHARAP